MKQQMVAIVTGGNSGLGFSTAKKLCDKGIITYIIGRSLDKLQQAKNEIGQYARIKQYDLTNLRGIPALINEIVKRLSPAS